QRDFKSFKNERIARLDETYISTTYAAYSNTQLKVYQDQADNYRNYAVIGGLAIYLLQIIDAGVEGHLMHFDTSDNLSIDWRPSFFLRDFSPNYGLTVRISF